MIMRSENVPESPSSALQTTYFWSAGCVEHRLPLDAGRERGAAASAQAGVGDLCDDLLAGVSVERVAQDRDSRRARGSRRATRIDDADAREREPLLLLQVRDLFGRTERERVLAALEKPGVEQARRRRRRHRPVGDAARRRRLDLDERLEPDRPREPLRTISTLDAALARPRARWRVATASAPSEQRARIARNEDRHRSSAMRSIATNLVEPLRRHAPVHASRRP